MTWWPVPRPVSWEWLMVTGSDLSDRERPATCLWSRGQCEVGSVVWDPRPLQVVGGTGGPGARGPVRAACLGVPAALGCPGGACPEGWGGRLAASPTEGAV